LFETLSRMGIEPMPDSESARPSGRFTEFRVIEAAQTAEKQPQPDDHDVQGGVRGEVAIGDKVVLVLGDGQRRSLELTEAAQDLEKGKLYIASALGKEIKGAEEGDAAKHVGSLTAGPTCKPMV
jgi:transcription elongation GreA/GreB family factor